MKIPSTSTATTSATLVISSPSPFTPQHLSSHMDDLLNAFAGLDTSSNAEMSRKFAEILRCSPEIATFFLEASAWNVESALNSYLSSVGDQSNLVAQIQSVPQASVQIIDQHNVLSGQLYCNQKFQLQWVLTNTGASPWPQGSMLIHTEGPMLEGPKGAQVGMVPAGQMVTQTLTLAASAQPGQYASTWRLKYNGGYFGDAIWIITTVVAPPPEFVAQQQVQLQMQQQMQLQQQQMQQQQMHQQQPAQGGAAFMGLGNLNLGGFGAASGEGGGGGGGGDGDDAMMDEDL